MNLNLLPQQIQNNIIMFQRPIYCYLDEINYLSLWYDSESIFHNENKYRWMFDALTLRRDIIY